MQLFLSMNDIMCKLFDDDCGQLLFAGVEFLFLNVYSADNSSVITFKQSTIYYML